MRTIERFERSRIALEEVIYLDEGYLYANFYELVCNHTVQVDRIAKCGDTN